MKCPVCDGHGGGSDGFGEWDDCQCCASKGTITNTVYDAWVAENARIDAQIDREMRAKCKKCGAIVGDHINRDGDPCKTAQQWNAENGYLRAQRSPSDVSEEDIST